MNQSIRNFARGLFSTIGIIYFFILPVYVPVRALGVELKSYEQMVTSPAALILYFLQIMLLITCNSILLSLSYEWISKRFFRDESFIIHWYRTTAIIYAIFFVISSYFILNPKDLLHLYVWSGVHYFIISFFQILIRSEINHAKDRNTTTQQANNYFGIMLNICGVITLAIFSSFQASHYSEYYSTFCLWLELGLCIYLLYFRKYYNSLFFIARQYSFKAKIKYFLLAVLALVFAAISSLIFVKSSWLGPLLLLAFIAYFYSKLKFEVHKKDLHLIINVSLSYGLVLAALSGSIMAFLIKNQSNNYNVFNYTYSSEPILSVIIGLIFSYYLIKNSARLTIHSSNNSIFILNCLVQIILGIFMLGYLKKIVLLTSLIVVFSLYAILEYLSLFFLKQIAQRDSYNEKLGAKLTNFTLIALNGLCPSLLYLLISWLTKFPSIELNQKLVIAVSFLAAFSLIYNLSQRYLVKYEFK